MNSDTIIIGIDGGATKVSGWIVNRLEKNGRFSISTENVQKSYRDYLQFDPEYRPVEIGIQLKEMSGTISLTDAEKQQGKVYIQCAADVIRELLGRHAGKHALIGIGMPGLKSPDRRGIVALANGPRMPEYAAGIEAEIEAAGLSLAAPIHHLGSDADYCGLGEEYSEGGLFSDVENAYYLGGGTGVADAMKLNGKLLPFDELKPWIAKAWEMKGDDDLSLERYASASGIQYIYSQKSGTSVADLNEGSVYPPQILALAEKGNQAAIQCMDAVARNVGALLFERMDTLYRGWNSPFDFVNPSRAELSKDHAFRGQLLDRIIIGQRLGDLMEASRKTDFLWKPILAVLGDLISAHPDASFRDHYLRGGGITPGLIHFSRLREAPAIGAGVDAWISRS